jgi:hypothetical protein
MAKEVNRALSVPSFRIALQILEQQSCSSVTRLLCLQMRHCGATQ